MYDLCAHVCKGILSRERISASDSSFGCSVLFSPQVTSISAIHIWIPRSIICKLLNSSRVLIRLLCLLCLWSGKNTRMGIGKKVWKRVTESVMQLHNLMGSKLILLQVKGVSVYCNGDYGPSCADHSRLTNLSTINQTRNQEESCSVVLLFNKQTFPGLLVQNTFISEESYTFLIFMDIKHKSNFTTLSLFPEQNLKSWRIFLTKKPRNLSKSWVPVLSSSTVRERKLRFWPKKPDS